MSNRKTLEEKLDVTGPNQKIYIGDLVDGKKNGQGKLTRINGDVLEGIFENNKFIMGRVNITSTHGKKYIGDWKNGGKNGQGKQIYPNGTVLDGTWKDGHFIIGHGTFADAYGHMTFVYDGEFNLDTHFHGYGIVKYVNGDMYEGEWKDGEKNGRGKLTLSNGKVYEGTFDQDAFVPDSNHTMSKDEDLGKWFRIYLRDPSGNFIEITEKRPYQFVKAKGLEYVFKAASSLDESNSVPSTIYVRSSSDEWKEINDLEDNDHLTICMPPFDMEMISLDESTNNKKYVKDFDTVRFIPIEKYRESQNHLVLFLFAHGHVYNNKYDRDEGKRCFKNVVMVSPIPLGKFYVSENNTMYLLKKKVCFELKHRSIQDVVKKLHILHSNIDKHPRNLFHLSFPDILLKQNMYSYNLVDDDDDDDTNNNNKFPLRRINAPFMSACFYNKSYDLQILSGLGGLFIATLRNKTEKQLDTKVNSNKSYDISIIKRHHMYQYTDDQKKSEITLYEIIDHFQTKGFQRITILDYSCSALNDSNRISINDEKLSVSPVHFHGGWTIP